MDLAVNRISVFTCPFSNGAPRKLILVGLTLAPKSWTCRRTEPEAKTFGPLVKIPEAIFVASKIRPTTNSSSDLEMSGDNDRSDVFIASLQLLLLMLLLLLLLLLLQLVVDAAASVAKPKNELRLDKLPVCELYRVIQKCILGSMSSFSTTYL